MRSGKIVADGQGNDILTNPQLLEESSIVLPQIAQVFAHLDLEKMPKNVIDIYEAKRLLMPKLRRNNT
jgi:hypothetical protein